MPSIHTARTSLQNDLSLERDPFVSEPHPHRDHFCEGNFSYAETLGLQLSIGALTVPGCRERANEDTFAVCKGESRVRLSVHDGTTYLGPKIPSLTETPGYEAAQFLRRAVLSDTTTLAPRELMLRYNAGLLEHARTLLGTSEPMTFSSLASTMSLVELDFTEGQFRFAHVSDTFVVVKKRDGSTTLVTTDTNAPFDEEVFALMRRLSESTGESPRSLRHHPLVIEKLAEISRTKNNRADGRGTGLLNGDTALEAYIQWGTIPLEDIEEIVLGTDGSLPLGWTLSEPQYRERLFEELGSEGGTLSEKLRALVVKKRESEASDPEWRRCIRWKPSDDGTLVYCKITRAGKIPDLKALPTGADACWPTPPDSGLSGGSLRGEG